jgi:competence protein ComEC
MTPLLAATLAYAAGLLVGLRWGAPAGGAVPATLLLVLVPVVLRGAPAGAWRGHAVILAFVAAGVLVGGTRGTSVRTDCRAALQDGTRLVLIGAPLAMPAEGAAVPFRIRHLAAASGAQCRGGVRIRAPVRHLAALDSAAHGLTAAVRVHGRWSAYPQRGGWPRPPQYAGVVLVDSLEAVHGAAAGTGADRFRVAQQARLRALLPHRWGLAEALLLAQKSGLTQETRARWVAAGLVHLLAISGMHVGLIAAGVLFLATAAGVPRRRARRLAVLFTAAYVLFLGAPTAALRALLQATLLLASAELQRPAEPFTLLAAAGLAILFLEPMALLDPGFQLSFAGMVGLVGWRRPVGALLPGRLPSYVRDGCAAGIAASALTTPIAALHFGQASWIGIPGSLLAVPLLAVAVCGLLLALVVTALTGSPAGPHALAADVPLRLLEWTAELCARVPGGHGHVAAPTVLALLAAAAAAIILRALLRGDGAAAEDPPPSHAPDAVHERFARRGRARRLRVLAAGSAAVAVMAWAPLIQPSDGGLAIHAIDVGQGDAFAIRTPRGRWILVDAGPRTPRTDAGRDRVVPFLLRHGARRIDALILTHPDADHIGGAAAVLEAFDVQLVIDPGMPAGKDIFIDLLAAARRRGQRWVAGRAGVAFRIDGVDFAVLYPAGESTAAAIANDNSVVFRLEYGAFAALFLGDAPVAVEDELVARHGSRLRAHVLKVGHHGSATSTGELLLRTTRPGIALVSAGRRNRYGHPAPSVVQRLERHDVRLLRTDEIGNITVRANRAGDVRVLAR